ncbi:MAG: hypothetical protein AAGF83_24160 [Cyanobacteria bacterium P01_G01_bin.67]
MVEAKIAPMSLQSKFNQVSLGGRNTQPLTPKQVSEVKAYSIVLGIPPNVLRFSDSMNTSYGNIFGTKILYVGCDVAPLASPPVSGITANSRITIKACLAHEWIGHHNAEVVGCSFNRGSNAALSLVDVALDEAQASIRAARFAPNLEPTERYTLCRDAISRLKNQNLTIRQVRHLLYISQP